MMAACQQYIGSEFLAILKKHCEEILGAGGRWSVEISKKDRNIVEFHYPPASTKALPYIAPQVVLRKNPVVNSPTSRLMTIIDFSERR
jgi:hypothetical protein